MNVELSASRTLLKGSDTCTWGCWYPVLSGRAWIHECGAVGIPYFPGSLGYMNVGMSVFHTSGWLGYINVGLSVSRTLLKDSDI
ncbi:hypothetical protein GDO78_016056 [Eleutherodactylus coqui]|uniref:Uncharacterized protein n=1 Tax=Eleutherodactylus coqui TaxID=57060 RepID=A0A8J6EBW8_ELECQ|nr:hypothetical protein GDO78_016056 [Eleutherodactylus coqui]